MFARRGGARAQGQVAAGDALAGDPRGGPAARRGPRRRARSAVRRTRRPICASSRISSTRPRTSGGRGSCRSSASPGSARSRLSWEFEKYIDGLPEDVWWHRGRCLSYGDGVAFWALAEMIRGRARIAENEDAATSTEKLVTMLELHVTDPEERAWIEPRLLQLLGPQRTKRPGSRGSLRCLEALLRAPGRGRPARHGRRGHPLGRRRARLVPRVPPRLGSPPPDLHAHARSAGGRRPPPRLPRVGPERNDAAARAARARGDGRAADGSRPGAPRRPARRSAQGGRGDSALRRRDRAHASRPRSPHRGRRLRDDRRRPVVVRDSRDPACADRLTARRRPREGAEPPAGRVGARQDVHARRPRRPLRS